MVSSIKESSLTHFVQLDRVDNLAATVPSDMARISEVVKALKVKGLLARKPLLNSEREYPKKSRDESSSREGE